MTRKLLVRIENHDFFVGLPIENFPTSGGISTEGKLFKFEFSIWPRKELARLGLTGGPRRGIVGLKKVARGRDV